MLALGVLLTSCGILPEEEELPGAPVIYSYETEEYKQQAVTRGDMIEVKEVRCTYMPAREVELSFGIGGEKMEKVFVEKGDAVKKGDLLAELSMGSLEEEIEEQLYQIEREELSLSQRKENYELAKKRVDLLLAENAAKLAASAPEEAESLKQEQTSLEAEKAALSEAYESDRKRMAKSLELKRKKLDELNAAKAKRQIIAPMDGVVTYLYFGLTDAPSVEGEKVMVLSDVSSSVFVVKGSDTVRFEVGQQVEVVANGKSYTAQMVDPASLQLPEEEADESLSEEEQLKNARAYFKLEQPDPSLKDGVGGRINLVLQEKRDTLFVTEDAVKSVNGKTVVYYLDENGLRAMKEVKTGMTANKQVEILEGLKEGEIVIAE